MNAYTTLDDQLKKWLKLLSMLFFAMLLSLITILTIPIPSTALTISREGQSLCAIILSDHASIMERTAASEIANYLTKVTGGRIVIKTEKELTGAAKNLIYVGSTTFSKEKHINTSKLESEEWIIKTFQENLIIIGGNPRGTLYAAYHFLEDIIGIHWWNPWEESAPKKRTLVVNNLDLHGKPLFNYRDIYMLYGHDRGLFAARNRLNRQGDSGIAPNYGGGLEYGPPYHAHTFYRYINPLQYSKDHPEWFSLINGRRTFERGQLCLTNQQLRKVFLSKLKSFIEKSQSDAKVSGLIPPVIFSISQNDTGGPCQCDNCQKIAKREGSESGPLIDFVNYMADGINKEYPNVYIDTLAYQYTEKPPKTIRPLDNVIIRLCNTRSNLIKRITHKDNNSFRELISQWAKISNNLYIWTYAITFDKYRGLPIPNMHIYADDYRFYLDHNVKGIFTEHERPILDDMRDFKIWMMMKQLENPYLDYKTLVYTFTDGFYGPAGKYMREYVTLLEQVSDETPTYIKFFAELSAYRRYLTPAFIREAQAIFNKAEKAVINDPMFSQRVRNARLSLDHATLLVPESGLNRDFITQRYLKTVNEQIDMRIPKNEAAKEKQKANERFK